MATADAFFLAELLILGLFFSVLGAYLLAVMDRAIMALVRRRREK